MRLRNLAAFLLVTLLLSNFLFSWPNETRNLIVNERKRSMGNFVQMILQLANQPKDINFWLIMGNR